jgi:hypothetical protein
VAYVRKSTASADRDDLLRIADLSDRVEQSLGGAVLSLAVAPNYHDLDGAVTSTPHIPRELPQGFGVERWKEQVRRDPAVYGVLVGREFEWAAVVLFLPNRDEVATFRAIAEFVEQRTIPWWEWLYKTDIAMPRMDVREVALWSPGRQRHAGKFSASNWRTLRVPAPRQCAACFSDAAGDGDIVARPAVPAVPEWPFRAWAGTVIAQSANAALSMRLTVAHALLIPDRAPCVGSDFRRVECA